RLLILLGLLLQLLLGALGPGLRSFLQLPAGLLIAGNPGDAVSNKLWQIGILDGRSATTGDRCQLTCRGRNVVILDFVLEVACSVTYFVCSIRNNLGCSINDWGSTIGGILANVFCPVPYLFRDSACQ